MCIQTTPCFIIDQLLGILGYTTKPEYSGHYCLDAIGCLSLWHGISGLSSDPEEQVAINIHLITPLYYHKYMASGLWTCCISLASKDADNSLESQLRSKDQVWTLLFRGPRHPLDIHIQDRKEGLILDEFGVCYLMKQRSASRAMWVSIWWLYVFCSLGSKVVFFFSAIRVKLVMQEQDSTGLNKNLPWI